MIAHCDVTERRTKPTDKGVDLPGAVVRCRKCGHAVLCFAATPSKVLHGGMVKLAQSCPGREGNFYRPDMETKREMKQWQEERKAAKRAAKGGSE